MTGANDTVDVPPFVDDETDEESKDPIQGADSGKEPVEGDSPEGIQAENELQSSGSDDTDDSEDTKDSDELLSKIEDIVLEGLKNYLSSETKDVDTSDDEPDGEDTERTSAMNYGDRKTATGIDGKPGPATNPTDVLDGMDRTGIDFATEVEKDRQKTPENVPDGILLGDNVGGSNINPGDIDPTNSAVSTPDKPGTASLASVVKLVDQFIKAGVYSDADRWNKVDELSTMSASAVKNQSEAVASVAKAMKEQSAQMAAAAVASAQANKKFAEDSSDDDANEDIQDDTTKDDKDEDDKGTEEKTSALIDRFGIARAMVTRKGNKRFAWSTGTHSGIERTMPKAIVAATKATGSRLDIVSEDTIIRASNQRKAAKRQADVKAARTHRSAGARTARLAEIQKEREARTARIQAMRTPKMSASTTGIPGVDDTFM